MRFDGRCSSVPFAYAHQELEVRGCAVALGVRAVENGFSVAFHRLEDLLAVLKRM